MRVALLGSGKTGGRVAELHEPTSVFNSSNPPTPEALKGHDVAISFLPGPPFVGYVDMLIDSRLPVVTGSTGIDTGRLDSRLAEAGLRWIWASNFSLGMELVRQAIGILAQADGLFEDYRISIHDIHHEHKRDAPSGTALSWRDWLGGVRPEVRMISDRRGDAVGFHELSLSTESETIRLSHEALDRSLFAKGALRAAHRLIENPTALRAGLNHFSDILERGERQ